MTDRLSRLHALWRATAPRIMGVVNVTPDSFSDGGDFASPARAIAHGVALWQAGAHVLDIGGEATNPAARPVSAHEESSRIMDVIAGLAAATDAVISVDTTKAAVAKAAIAAGAQIVNDVSGGRFDGAMQDVLRAHPDVGYVVGHLRGGSMAEVFAVEASPPSWAEVAAELGARVVALGLTARPLVWLDPGLGFGKGASWQANIELVDRAGELARLHGQPVLIGASRKRFLRARLPAGCTTDALIGSCLDSASVAVSLRAYAAGAAMARVHNVAGLAAALAVQ